MSDHPVTARSRRWHRSTLYLLTLSLCAARLAHADIPPHLVRDINTTALPASSYPGFLGVVGGHMLFGGRDATGPGLWSTDGTAQGTILVKRVTVYAQNVFPGTPNFALIGGRGYFVGDDGSTGGSELWSTDGSPAGTMRLTHNGYCCGGPQLRAVLSSRLVFSANDSAGVIQEFITDGSPTGTIQLTALTGPEGVGVVDSFILVGSKFYFLSVDQTYSQQIWASDGTVAGTHTVATPADPNALYGPHAFTAVNNLVLYESAGQLWSIDTTTDTISQVIAMDGFPGFGPPRLDQAIDIVALPGLAIFRGSNQTPDMQQLWRSDGSPTGTYPIATIDPGPNPNNVFPLLRTVGSRALFVALDPQNGTQLWSSDGTAANTVRLTSAPQSPDSVSPFLIPLATIANNFYFAVADAPQSTSWSIWRTDGTVAGTQRAGGLPSLDESEAGVTQLAGDSSGIFVSIVSSNATTMSLYKYNPAAQSAVLLNGAVPASFLESFVFAAGKLYFTSNDPLLGDEPWVSDGTPAGTHMLIDLNPESSNMGSNPDEFVNFNGVLAFVADDGAHGRQLWRSDGTTPGTTALLTLAADAVNPSHLFAHGRNLFFFAADASGTQRFMRLSSGSARPQVLAKLSPPPAPQPPFFFPTCAQGTPAVIGEQVYFAASDGASGLELWRTDGTQEGTRRVADINPGPGDSNPCYLTVLNGRLWFSAGGPGGTELWTSDGSRSGTFQVADIVPGPAGSYPGDLTAYRGGVYFDLGDGMHPAQVWRADGSTGGTALFADLAPTDPYAFAAPLGVLGQKLLIYAFVSDPAQPYGYAQQLWSSNGTQSGTTRVGTVNLAGLFLINGPRAYFSAQTANGPEPWVSDGSTTGTRLLKDISPTPSTTIDWLEAFQSLALFAVADPNQGVTLWQSNGTASGTTPIAAIPAEPAPTVALHRLTVGDTFFFVANDPRTGSELWAYTHCAQSTGERGPSSCRRGN